MGDGVLYITMGYKHGWMVLRWAMAMGMLPWGYGWRGGGGGPLGRIQVVTYLWSRAVNSVIDKFTDMEVGPGVGVGTGMETGVENMAHNMWGGIQGILDSYYISYYVRQNLYAMVFSESHPLGQLQHFALTNRVAIFNIVLFMMALGCYIRDQSSRKTVDKLLDQGVVSKKTVRNIEIFILVFTTVMTKDVENATGMGLGGMMGLEGGMGW